jgi:hypothetical protein
MKTCTQCGETKPLDRFSPNKTGKDGRHTWCKSCKSASARIWQTKHHEHKRKYDSEYYATHQDAGRAQARRWHYEHHARSLENKRKWKLAMRGLTDVQREAIYHDQGGTCAICAKAKPVEQLKVDHDHATGVIRGLLCHHCNVGLGHFFDVAETLRSAASYLEVRAKRKQESA